VKHKTKSWDDQTLALAAQAVSSVMNSTTKVEKDTILSTQVSIPVTWRYNGSIQYFEHAIYYSHADYHFQLENPLGILNIWIHSNILLPNVIAISVAVYYTRAKKIVTRIKDLVNLIVHV
jgi:hypothetical protein